MKWEAMNWELGMEYWESINWKLKNWELKNWELRHREETYLDSTFAQNVNITSCLHRFLVGQTCLS